MHINERDLLEIPILFIIKNGDKKPYVYNRGYTIDGLPFYSASFSNDNDGGPTIEEFIFLPISNKEFLENNTDLFYGFRFIIVTDGSNSMSLVDTPDICITRIQISYDINRICYYPKNKKTIVIKRNCDNLIPTQVMDFQSKQLDVYQDLLNIIGDILNSYCNFYLDRKI